MMSGITGTSDAVKPVRANDAQRVAIMLPKALSEYLKKRKFESEPHRNRTCNLLIKRDEPPMLLDASKGDLLSAGQKFSFGYYLVYYLVPYGVGNFVGKMLAKILLLIESVYRREP